jgi:hypothetical protein
VEAPGFSPADTHDLTLARFTGLKPSASTEYSKL